MPGPLTGTNYSSSPRLSVTMYLIERDEILAKLPRANAKSRLPAWRSKQA